MNNGAEITWGDLRGRGRFVVAIGSSIMLFLSIWFQGAVLSQLWQWFVVGWLNLPRLPILTAIGVIMIVDFFRGISKPSDNVRVYQTIMEAINQDVVHPILILVAGWVIWSLLH